MTSISPATTHNNSVSFFPVKPPYSKEDPGIPDINCATFAVCVGSKKEFRKPIHYGQHIKLKHIASGHYLQADKAKTSQSGELNHMVNLQRDNKCGEQKGSLFKIVPQYGLRTRASEVHFNQPLRFESVNISGHFLHCSDNTYGSNLPVYADRYELNLSSVASHLMVVSHFQPEPAIHIGLQIRAGQLLQFCEANDTFTLIAKGSFVQAPTVVEDVHLRGNYTDVCQSWFPPSLWQLEEETEPMGGPPLKFNLRYRIKHVLTRKYLAVVRCEKGGLEEYKVVLQDRTLAIWPECDYTTFSIIPPSQQEDEVEDDHVLDGEHLLIKHTLTGLWLNITQGGTGKGTSNLDADPLKKLSLGRYAKDGFTVSCIPQNLQNHLYEVAGIAQVLDYSVLTGNIDPRVMKELVDLEDIQTKRPFLRHLQVVDMLLKITTERVVDIGVERFCRSAFEVFEKYAATDDLSDKNYLAPYLPFFWSQVGKGLNAEEVVLSLVKDNLEIVLRMGESLIQDTFRQLTLSKDEGLLLLLGHLCVCCGMAISSNQTYILENIIKSSQGNDLLYKTALEDGELCIQIPGAAEFLTWEECSPEAMKFLESQLLLFAKLCEGNHRESIIYLDKDQGDGGYVSFEEALAIVSDVDLPKTIQARYLHLIRVMFVEGHEAGRALFKSPTWCLDATTLVVEQEGNQEQQEPVVVVDGMQNDVILQLKPQILQLLQPEPLSLFSHFTLRMSTTPKNILGLLNLLSSMVNYGYYCTTEEVKPIVQSCVSLLHTTQSTEIQDTIENLLAMVFHVELKATAEGKACAYQQNRQRSRRTARSEYLNNLSVLDGIRTATTPKRVLPSHFYWMSLQTMQHDIQLLTVDESLQEVDEIWKLYPSLQHCLRNVVSSEESRKAADVLLEFSKRCIVNGLPHRRNQEIYFNFALEDILNFVLNPYTALMQKTHDSYAEGCKVLLDACFIFLKSLAYKKPSVQMKLFSHLDDFLEIRCAVPAMADLLSEIFAGGSLEDLPTEAHLQHIQAVHLQITKEHVGKMFKLVCKGEGVNELIYALQFLAKYEGLDLPIPYNQKLLMAHFQQSQKAFCGYIGSGQKMQYRMDLIKKKPTEHTTHSLRELMLLLNVTTLLASCAEGGDKSTCAKCQALFSTHELLSILNDDDISYAFKNPFLQFLVSVYINDDFGLKMDDEMLWEYLKNVARLMKDAKVVLEGQTKESVQAALLSTRKELEGHIDEGDSNWGNKELQGILQYVLKGVLPLLKRFYQRVVCHPSVIESMKQQPQVSMQIYTTLWELSGVFMKIPLPQHHRQSLQVTVMAVTVSLFSVHFLTHDSLPAEASKRLNSANSVEFLGTSSILSLEEYNELYSSEELLNGGFRPYLKEELKRSRGKKKRRLQTVSEVAEGPGIPEFLDLLKSGKVAIQDVSSIITERLLNEVPLKKWKTQPHICNIALQCLQTIRAYAQQHSGDKFSVFCEKLETELVVQVMNLASLSDVEDLSKEALALLVSLLDSPDSPIVKRLTESVQRIGDPHMQSAEAHVDSQKLQQALSHLMQSIDRSIRRAMTISSTRIDIWKEVSLRSKEDSDVRSSFESYAKAPKKKSSQEDNVWINVQGDEANDAGNSYPLVPLSSDDDIGPDAVLLPDTPAQQKHAKYPSPSENGLQAVIPGIDNLKLMLRLLGLMCEGQNQTLQDYLQKQPGQIESVNIVRDLHQLLKHFQKMHTNSENVGVLELSVEDLQVLQLILQTMILFCKANVQNQTVVVGGKVDDSIQWLLALTVPSKGTKYPSELLKLKSTAVSLIDILTEEREDDFKELLHNVELQDTFTDALNNFHTAVKSHTVSATGLWQRLVRGGNLDISKDSAKESLIRVYHSGLGKTWETKGEKNNALSFCEKNSRSIEVLYENKEGEQIHTTVTFPYDPTDELGEHLKHSLKAKVERNNPEDKLLDFMDWMDAAKRDIQWQRKIRHNIIGKNLTRFRLTVFIECMLLKGNGVNKFFAYALIMLISVSLHSHVSLVRLYLLVLLTFLVNVNILITYGNNQLQETISFGLGGTHAILSLWMVSEYYGVNWPHFFVHGLLGAIVSRFIWRFIFKVTKTFLHTGPTTRWKQSLRIWLEDKVDQGKYELSFYGLESTYRMIFLAASVASLFFDGLFYPICTFYIIFTSDVLREVLRSITKHGKSLLLVGILAILVLYTYSVASYVLLHDEDSLLEETPGLHCDSLWECFVSVSRVGLLSGLGEIPLITGEFREVALRVFYDVSFFIIVTTFGLNIILGIIVDTFSELREERSTAHRDSKDFCFICNIPSHEFDHKENNGFQRHIKQNHGMWNYIYYYVYLDSLDPYNHTAVQSYVYRKIQSKQIKFFPLHMAKCLGGVYTSNHLEQKVDELNQAINAQGTTLQEINEAVGRPDRRGSTMLSPVSTLHRSRLGSLATPLSIVVHDDPNGSHGGGSRRKSINALQDQVDVLSQQIVSLNSNLAAILQRLQRDEDA